MTENNTPATASATDATAAVDAAAAGEAGNGRTLLVGTRGSTLATTQSGHVRSGMIDAGYQAELHIVHTPGDASQASQIPVAKVGVGVFTETLRIALDNKECDVAVHSYKDLPTAPDPRFRTIVPERVDNREVLISVDNKPLMELPEGAKVGTSAPRRVSQIRAVRPDLQLLPLRGNIGTRMGRVGDDLDAVILARAGLERVGWLDKAAESIDPSLIMPAPAQGALSVEVRADDHEAYASVADQNHLPTFARVVGERAVLCTLEAGCSAPVAAYSTLSDDERTLTITGGVFAIDGSKKLIETETVEIDLAAEADVDPVASEWHAAAYAAGEAIGRKLLDAGAAQLVDEARQV